MNKTILKLVPVFQEKIWGGNRLATNFNYDIPSDKTGECWAISGHPGGDCAIENPEYASETLASLWKKKPELFGNVPGDIYPLLIKIIDAKDDLSIQVHPDDAYAMEHENGSLGKTECWYILDCNPNTSIVIGHHAKTKEEMEQMIAENRWNELIREVPIQKGDFFQINPGCVHAIKGGTLILETQQSSDVTYRFYDYGRLENGKPRPLHIRQSLDVTEIPFKENNTAPNVHTLEDATISTLVTCKYYSVSRVELNGTAHFDWNQPFVNISILSGEGTFDGQPVKKGDHLVITANYGMMELTGNLEFMYSHISSDSTTL